MATTLTRLNVFKLRLGELHIHYMHIQYQISSRGHFLILITVHDFAHNVPLLQIIVHCAIHTHHVHRSSQDLQMIPLIITFKSITLLAVSAVAPFLVCVAF